MAKTSKQKKTHTPRPKMFGKVITIKMPHKYLEMLDVLIENNITSNRAEAIREAVREYCKFHGIWPEKLEDHEKGVS